jgi:hypothetical protein
MCNYYRPYICNYGKMAKPLTELTTDRFGRDISEQWDADEKYQAAFDGSFRRFEGNGHDTCAFVPPLG